MFHPYQLISVPCSPQNHLRAGPQVFAASKRRRSLRRRRLQALALAFPRRVAV
jgi:hypothetical protein